MATNLEIVELEAMMIGYEFDGNNLKSFAEWKKEGYSVIKGQKAIIKCGLWKPFKKKLVDEKTGEKIMDDKTGKQKEETRFKLVDTALFTREQVEKKNTKKGEKEMENYTSQFKMGDKVEVTYQVTGEKHEAVITNVYEKVGEVTATFPSTVSGENGEPVDIRFRGEESVGLTFSIRPLEEKETVIIEEAVTPFVKIEAVVQPDAIEIVEEKPAIEIKKARFESKPSNIEEVKKGEISSYDKYAVAETIELSIVEFYDLCDSLLSDREYLEGKGGTYTTTEPEGCEDVENFFDLTPAQQDEWRKGAYRNCVKVTCVDATFDILIDPQGYNYGRYVAIEYK
ncbi:hypothetical protein LAV92_28095 [Bacillus cereus]|uniref:hypothetical protein n=1 Tax=Bacillus cereus TaxID=1396 RepID=UPI0023E3724D|nr:hypothetical protein [Bacillus cereus]MDF3555526.1 hypothetical protein [Bacillus cereus]